MDKIAAFQVLLTWWEARSEEQSVGALHPEPLPLPWKQEKSSQNALLLFH